MERVYKDDALNVPSQPRLSRVTGFPDIPTMEYDISSIVVAYALFQKHNKRTGIASPRMVHFTLGLLNSVMLVHNEVERGRRVRVRVYIDDSVCRDLVECLQAASRSLPWLGIRVNTTLPPWKLEEGCGHEGLTGTMMRFLAFEDAGPECIVLSRDADTVLTAEDLCNVRGWASSSTTSVYAQQPYLVGEENSRVQRRLAHFDASTLTVRKHIPTRRLLATFANGSPGSEYGVDEVFLSTHLTPSIEVDPCRPGTGDITHKKLTMKEYGHAMPQVQGCFENGKPMTLQDAVGEWYTFISTLAKPPDRPYEA